MDKDFNVFKLGEVAEIIAGGDKPKIFSENRSDVNCVPVIANGEKNDGLLGYTDLPKIVVPAVTVSARGSKVGFTAIRKQPFFPIVRLLTLIPNRDRLDVNFLFYNLKQNRQSGIGSGQPQITVPDISNRSISVPSLLAQQISAKVLSDLDAKIELNNKINTELEAMAKLMYDYWFVQFDFPDKNGKPYKSSGREMVFNEELKREIPEGWSLEKLSSCCKIVDCLHSKKSDFLFEDEKYYLLQLENIKDDGLIDLSKKYFVSKGEYNRWTTRIEVQDHDLVITNAGRVAGLSQIPKDVVAGIGRNITAIRPDTISPTFLYYTFQGAEMERQIKLNTDTGSFFKSLNVRGIKELYVVRPPKHLEEKFEKMSLSSRRRRELNSTQNQQLIELRDWLLPMLMNGQVKVK